MEIKNLNLIPEGDKPIIHASQFDENRTIRFDLKDGTEDYTLLADLIVTCNIKKVDGNIVTFEVENTESTYVVITLPLQATACAGPNIGEIVITDEETSIIGTINFILEVERSPMLGGIESVSDIHDLEYQIEVIVTQVIATDYYTKTEVDNLLNDKADISDLPDMDNYYDKSSVDTLLNGKANVSDLNNYYNKSQVDNLLDDKADISDLPDMSDYYDKSDVNALLAEKADISDLPDMSNYYTKTEVDNKFLDIMPVNSASGSIANFTTSLALPLVALKAYIQAQGGGGTPSAPVAITGFDSVKIYQRGINLWNEQCEQGAIDSSGNDATDNQRIRPIGYISIAGSTSFYCVAPTNLDIYYYDANKTFISVEYTRNNRVFTTPANCKFIRFRCGGSGYPLTPSTYGHDIAILYPSTQTAYALYNPNSTDYTIQLGQTCYGGYIDKSTGKLVFTFSDIVDLGDLNFTYQSAAECFVSSDIASAIKRPASNNDTANIMCSMLATTYANNTSIGGLDNSIAITTTGNIVVKATSAGSSTTDLADLLQNSQFIYELATPISTDITIPDITALVGENNIFADSGDIEISFKQDIANYVDSKIADANANRTLSMIRPVTTEESKGDEDER